MKNKQTTPSRLAFYKRIWQTVQPFHKHFAILFILILLVQAINSIQTWYLAKGIEYVMRIGVIKVDPSYLLLLLGISSGASIFRNLVSYIRDQYERKNVDWEFNRFMSRLSLNKYLSFSLGQHIAQHSSISQKIVSDGQSAIQSTLQLFTYDIIPNLGQLIVALSVLFFVHPILGSIACFLSVLSFFIFKRLNLWIIPEISKQNDLSRTYGKRVSETYRNVMLITMESQQERSISNVMQSYENFSSFALGLWKKFWDYVFFIRFYWEILRVIMYVVAVIMIFKGYIESGTFIMVYIWVGNILSSIHAIDNVQRRLSIGIADIKKYFELLDTKPVIQNIPNPKILHDIKGEIEFKNVTFNYPVREADTKKSGESGVGNDTAIKNISFNIEAGQKIGIVGESGSGKTTIMNLIRRAFEPTEGVIYIDGYNLNELELCSYRQKIGNVDQQVQLFDTTIRENILFGLSDKQRELVTEKDLERVTKIAAIDRFEHRLEHGLDTLIGEHGVKLSGGERQRIAIARALIKNPSIMIFDEATSSLDTRNERSIADAIDEASKDRTTIIVAHRLSTVRNADKIFVFDQGNIVGEGTHDELLNMCKQYEELVKDQLVEVL